MRTDTFKRFVSAASLIFALCVVANLSYAQPGPNKRDIKRAKDLNERADKAFNQKNYQVAIDGYAQAIVLVPNDPKAHFWKGYAHYYLKQFDQAAAELSTALDKGYTPLKVYEVRWYVQLLRKDYDDAYADVKQGNKLDPTNVNFLKGLAQISFAKGLFPESLDAYQKAVAQEPNNADLYYGIATNQFRLGNTAAQAAAAEEALKRNTQYRAEASYLIANAYYKLRKFPEAIPAYLEALNLKKDIYAVYIELADIYRDLSRFNDAIDISKKGLNAFPRDGNIYTSLSWYYSLAGRNEDAVQAALAGVQLLPGNSLPFTNLCRAYNDTKQYALAMNACNSALKIAPNDGETNLYLGRTYELSDKKTEAAKYYDRAVAGLETFTSQNTTYSDGFYLLGNAYYYDDQYDKSIEAYNKCLQLSPRFPRGHYNLGVIYVYRRNKAGAQEQYNALLSLDAALAAQLKTQIDGMK